MVLGEWMAESNKYINRERGVGGRRKARACIENWICTSTRLPTLVGSMFSQTRAPRRGERLAKKRISCAKARPRSGAPCILVERRLVFIVYREKKMALSCSRANANNRTYVYMHTPFYIPTILQTLKHVFCFSDIHPPSRSLHVGRGSGLAGPHQDTAGARCSSRRHPCMLLFD